MPENFEAKFSVERAPERKVMQITHRDYKSYMYAFNLPEKSLANAETVVDVGAGFSTFSQEAREKFDGLKTIAVDPIYEAVKSDRYKTLDEFQNSEGVFFDFDPNYRGEEKIDDLDLYRQTQKQFYAKFKHFEVLKHPAEYIAASHQDLPLPDKSADVVLACNSILRNENSPQVIEKAIRESLRVAKDNGEVRLAGAIACLIPTEQGVELWYNGTLKPGSPQSEEFQKTGRYSDPELMQSFTNIEAEGANFYCVIKSTEKDGKRRYRFDTLIVRKDQTTPEIEPDDTEGIKIELRKLDFVKNDGFNIPTLEI